jgi:copper chaperone CopZ
MESNKVEIRVGNLDCEHDAANIERKMEGFTGLLGMKVYPQSAKVVLTYDPDQTNPNALKENKIGCQHNLQTAASSAA